MIKYFDGAARFFEFILYMDIVSKVPKGDNLLLGPQRFIVKTLIIQNAHSRYFYTQAERRGNRQAARETEKESVRVWVHCRKTDDGIRHKN